MNCLRLPLFTISLALFAVPACERKSETSPEPANPEQATVKAETPPAADSEGTKPASKSKGRITKPFLWSVSKDGKRTGFLLGTMHMGVDAEKEFPPVVWQALNQADIVCSEADVRDPSLIKAMMRTDGTTLDQELGADTWAKVTKILGPMANGMKGMKPSAAASMLMLQGLPITPAMDLVIENKATAAKKKILHLEKAMFQLALLDKHMDADSIRAMLKDFDKLKDTSAQMLAAYMDGDGVGMEKLLTDTSSWQADDEEKAKLAMEEMLYQRNADWIPKLEKMFSEHTPFCAVGAGHLLGARSVVELLEKKGYAVKRISTL